MRKNLRTLCLFTSLSFIISCSHSPVTTEKETLTTRTWDNRSPSGELDNTPWTTWSLKGKVGALAVLSGIRDNLLKIGLHDPHINYSGYAPVDCSQQNTEFRSADGTCNVLESPHVGAAGVAFGRNVDPKFVDKKANEKLLTPSPAAVSKEFFTRDQFKPVPFLNMLAASWIQFMNHDWLSHGRNIEENPYKVTNRVGDETEIERTKTSSVDPSHFKSEFGKVTLNDVTHWWDGSQLYGSSQAEQNRVRSFSRGKMKTVLVNGHELLPKTELNVANNKQNQGYELTGFRDNWWVGLSMLHTLFVKEHNKIADMLLKNNAKYDAQSGRWIWRNGSIVKSFTEAELDEQIFQTARLINAAVMAKIHTVEWTPAILPNPTLKTAMMTNWYGIANPKTWSKFIKNIPGFDKTDWFKNINAGYVIGGIVGDKTNNFGVPYSITEEFTSVYRLHSLLPESLIIKSLKNKSQVQSIAFQDSRNEKSYGLMTKYDTQDLFYSFGTQLPGQLVLNNFPKFMQDLQIPGHGIMDLGMVDIMRDRERGVPRYNQFRRAIGLKPIKSYRDFFYPNQPLDERQLKIIEKFDKVYGKTINGEDNVEMIDLLVGTLSEEVRPQNFGFGETQFQIFILMASRRLMADRFYTTDFTAPHYTTAGLEWIDKEGTLAKIIVRHMPDLASKVAGLETAFNPWKN